MDDGMGDGLDDGMHDGLDDGMGDGMNIGMHDGIDDGAWATAWAMAWMMALRMMPWRMGAMGHPTSILMDQQVPGCSVSQAEGQLTTYIQGLVANYKSVAP